MPILASEESIADFIEAKLKLILDVPDDQPILRDRSWQQIGLCSLSFYELQDYLLDQISPCLGASLVLDYPSINQLAHAVYEQFQESQVKQNQLEALDLDASPRLLTQSSEFSVWLYREEEISPDLHREIHGLLNIAYKGISKSFYAKTYAHIPPTHRVLAYHQGQLVAHMGLREDCFVEPLSPVLHELPFVWLGLFASISNLPGFGEIILGSVIEYLKQEGHYLALALSERRHLIDHVILNFSHTCFQLQFVGCYSQSKPTQSAILFQLGCTDHDFKAISDELHASSRVSVMGEVF